MSIICAGGPGEAVRCLHQAKDAVHHDAWKKHGDVMSIMADITCKVNRLEYVVDGASATANESPPDTTVDLLPYPLKYQAHLADQVDITACKLSGSIGVIRPYSNETSSFDALLARPYMVPAELAFGPAVADAAPVL